MSERFVPSTDIQTASPQNISHQIISDDFSIICCTFKKICIWEEKKTIFKRKSKKFIAQDDVIHNFQDAKGNEHDLFHTFLKTDWFNWPILHWWMVGWSQLAMWVLWTGHIYDGALVMMVVGVLVQYNCGMGIRIVRHASHQQISHNIQIRNEIITDRETIGGCSNAHS